MYTQAAGRRDTGGTTRALLDAVLNYTPPAGIEVVTVTEQYQEYRIDQGTAAREFVQTHPYLKDGIFDAMRRETKHFAKHRAFFTTERVSAVLLDVCIIWVQRCKGQKILGNNSVALVVEHLSWLLSSVGASYLDKELVGSILPG
jgi:hypothetical protein